MSSNVESIQLCSVHCLKLFSQKLSDNAIGIDSFNFGDGRHLVIKMLKNFYDNLPLVKSNN